MRKSYNILHLATHAVFLDRSPENSFILMGDGNRLNLQDIKNWQLPNVDLITLSACQTALGGELGSGLEVLGFGYQLQLTGARSSISSLWSVDDGGTQRLMKIFYSLLQQGMPKAEALQQAQVALIKGDFTANGKLRGSFIIEATTGTAPIETNLKHPFYWAPFILIGNGL